MNEKTLIKTLELPHGQNWAWYGDANIVVLSPCLDAEGREQALSELQDHWRRKCLRVVGLDDEAQPTQPLTTVPRKSIRDVVEAL